MTLRSRSAHPTTAAADGPTKPAEASAATVGAPSLTTSTFARRQPAGEGRAPFTLDDIKNAIPKHCFERPLYKSFGYLFYDLAVIALLIAASLFFKQAAIKLASLFCVVFGLDESPLAALVADSALSGAASPFAAAPFAVPTGRGLLALFGETAHALFALPLRAALTSAPLAVYSVTLAALSVGTVLLQGAVMTGAWVIGHECGHGGFAASKPVCDAVGLVLHTVLFVPYHSWAISHRTHHSNNANIELDEVHLPEHVNAYARSAAHGYLHNDSFTHDANASRTFFLPRAAAFVAEVNQILSDFNFIHRCISTFLTCTIGWFLYLLINASGRRYEKTSWLPVNHFTPSSPIFKPQERVLVWISNAAMLGWLGILVRLVRASSLATVSLHFLLPYLVVQYWLVVITLLQHTHTALPHYSTRSWDYVRGALATVDRDYGAFFNFTLHNINDTHVVHHLFSYLPHYHALEATKAVRDVLGEWYVRSDAEAAPFGVLKALWTAARECNFIAEDGHPALALAEDVIRAQRAGKTPAEVAAAVDATKEAALAAGPHANGRDPSKEVYWFRTVHIE